MLTINNLELRFADKILFEEVNLKFTPGNCYGVIGANGCGKSTFLKILASEIEPTKGDISITPGQRIAVLKQDHFEFDEFSAVETVIKGYKKLYDIMTEKDALYEKEDFSDEDGIKCAQLESDFAELDGWSAESDAERLLIELGVQKDNLRKLMKNIPADEKVKVLLAQALFGKPDILLLDEPTNHLDFHAITWLENFLLEYENTVVVVSHDRHFLNKICTHTVDIDFGKAKMLVGNYDFWYQSSQLALELQKNINAKKEEQIKELQTFIAKFSANASKAKQATSRKKLLDKIELDDIRPSSRKYPFVSFIQNRELGKEVLKVESLTKTIDGVKILDNVSFNISAGDKCVFVSDNSEAATTLFKILSGELEQDSGDYKWGATVTHEMLPKDNNSYFDEESDLNLLDWLRQYSPAEQDENFIRGFLGKMLFAQDEVFKKAKVLSGGEKMRCMFSRLMLSGANVLLVDEPTNHLDLESIQSVNDGLAAFKGCILLSSHDHKLIQSVVNKVVTIADGGASVKECTFNEYLDEKEKALLSNLS